MNNICPVSVVIPTWRRRKQLSKTLKVICSCSPSPAEILVHIDADDTETFSWLTENFPEVRVLQSAFRIGPGGGRNKLIPEAQYPIVEIFDDDCYPVVFDYFLRLIFCFERYPEISVLASKIIELTEPVIEAHRSIGLSSHFGGGGVAYRQEDFIASKGYIPLAVAYGIEEVDLCIRFIAMNKKIFFSPWLRVFHNSNFAHHQTRPVVSASISNLALLVFLRYPKRYWIYGTLQVINRIVWLMRAKRFSGIGRGLVQIPLYLWRHKHLRQPVSSESLQIYFNIRKSDRILQPIT